MTVLPSGTVTFLFTDIEGSTRLWQEHPDTMQPALARHDEILRTEIETHGGYVVKTTGDGFHAVFATAHDALAAALAAQAALADAPWDETGPLVVRMGLHTGETQERDGDYFGTAVNRAARVMAVAHGGQVLATRATIEVAGEGIDTRSLGEHRLRDLGAAQELFQVGNGAFPPLQSVDVVPTNLPTVRTELIGRHDDIDTLAALVLQERLVTLTGVGGVGKTRLALGIAAAVAADFADGCWFVELAPVSDGDEVVTVVAGAMRAPMTALDTLADYLSDRRMVVVLDNCEHVLDAAAELVDEILAVAPDVHFLVTSREPLGLDGEQVRRVQSLALPDAHSHVDAAGATASVRLFAERAAAVSDGFAIDESNVDAVVEICRHLDGIPLAIELAAARVRAMSPAEIASRLDERFRLLAGGSRRSQERHRTLQATVAWSHDLLTEPERMVFRQLSVFPASFDLGAAEAVIGDGDDDVDVVECVLRLVDRSLVVYEPAVDRYRLLETLRQFGADRLTDAGETEDVRSRHAAWYLALAGRVAPGLGDERFATARVALAADLDNLRATADWCTETGAWRELANLCDQLFLFLTQDAAADGAGWLEVVVEHAGDLDPRRAVDALGSLAWLQVMNFGAFEAADELVDRSVTLAERLGVDDSTWACLAAVQTAIYTFRPDDVRDWSAKALDRAEATDDTSAAVLALCSMTRATIDADEFEHGAERLGSALKIAERTGNALIIQSVVIIWSQWLLLRDPPDFAASLELLRRYGADLTSGDLGAMWHDVAWAEALLGCGEPGAVAHAARAARAADRQRSPHGLDFALLMLAVSAAEAGFIEPAVAFDTYANVHLRESRFADPGQAWLHDRLARALGEARQPSATTAVSRSELMALITEVEAALTGGSA
jgi:predicted ATPase/class 3 adenylate cyclase